MPQYDVLLASGSPQRKAILEELGIRFQALPMDVDEVTLPSPEETVLENARLKLRAALPAAHPGQAVIAADTVVWADGHVLGKPGNADRARQYLQVLSGNSVQAYSGIAVALGGADRGWICAESATFFLQALTEAEISWYISTKEPLNRAGAIGISHYGEVFVSRIEGSYSCIAGLPKNSLLAILAQSPALAQAVLPVAAPPAKECTQLVELQKIVLE